MQTDELITSGEMAKIVGVHVKTIIRWATVPPIKITPAQKLPGLRGAYLFDPKAKDVLALIAAARDLSEERAS